MRVTEISAPYNPSVNRLLTATAPPFQGQAVKVFGGPLVSKLMGTSEQNACAPKAEGLEGHASVLIPLRTKAAARLEGHTELTTYGRRRTQAYRGA